MTLTIEVDFETYAEGLDRRATILREWLLFLKTFRSLFSQSRANARSIAIGARDKARSASSG